MQNLGECNFSAFFGTETPFHYVMGFSKLVFHALTTQFICQKIHLRLNLRFKGFQMKNSKEVTKLKATRDL